MVRMPLNRITLVVQPIPKVWMFRSLAISTPFPHHLPWLFRYRLPLYHFMTGSYRHWNRREAPSCHTRICFCPSAWQKIQAPSIKQEGGWCKIEMTHLRCTKILKVSFFQCIASLLIQRTNIQKICMRLLENCWLLWFAWECSESQNLPKMK